MANSTRSELYAAEDAKIAQGEDIYEAEAETSHGNLGIFRLVTTVITLIVGGGVWSLAGDQAAGGASGAAILTSWGISAIGVFCLVMLFFALSRIKPQLKGGIYSYASAGFGDFLGFNSAWGYWISALLCTVSFSALLFGALSYFFPVFGNGNNLPSIIGASLLIWFYVFLVSRGVREVTGINAVITISKIVPIFVAIMAIIFLNNFDPAIFMANMAEGAEPGMPFMDQVNNTMMVTIWVFIGIEGAVAISGRAKHQSDVGKATIIAFICVLAIYLMVSTLSMGVMPLADLAELPNPALAGVMEYAVGEWGAILINAGVVLSLVGAMLGYTVLSAESPFEAAQEGVFTKSFAKVNKKGAPIVTLIVTNIIIEIFLIIMLFSDSTYQFFYRLSAGMILLPYLLSAAYFAKITVTEPEAFAGKIGGNLILWRIFGVLGVIYGAFLAWASGFEALMIMSLLYAPGILVYIKGKKERNEPYLRTVVDKVVVAIILIAAITSVIMFATGAFVA
ncbi:basic amino acid/polyamine antiporter [Adlercreutzia agrestimuris]|uniref:basic amino acid/polyamine antiporter n=1 Tax=Adlercreutzia agrestimuris TaxID=2941324 RepID=UPI00203C3417|nr:basic amino acid/polyamine antiporter [Adlercreutzia agrestimuris]